ncbi:DNA repair protein RadA [Austwickia sp. TVS 96-490-7B]|uniref:replicative DNA helicase n=1 Tax=Austwickia sp. TVS 96-490-7B TaxID=2830843 RepID=UPI001C564B58|nr:replicative DNA helicase [Austwickia sp. TVS 96-490-7B]MBW3084124.1 DNA repair protein RadA [Austwickia sp. TVS 96-490-7B]
MSISELEEQYAASPSGPNDRMPPQDVTAERSVLGGMLLSKDAIADCVEALRGTDFYRPAHELIYDAILDLYGRGEPADAITVADELTKRGDLTKIGGQAYLHDLISSVPTAANAGYYAHIVAERATLRRLVDAGTRIVQMGFGQGGGDVEEIVNAAQAEVYAVADKRGGEDYHLLRDLLEPTYDEIEAAGGASGEMSGVPTGFTELDELTNGLHGGQMIVIAARPAVGKSTLALDFARAAAIKNQQATVIFSLEMSKSEITMRLISAEAGINLSKIRRGKLEDRDWEKLARLASDFDTAPLFIDDSPNMSLMEIRAKCRRLKQRNNLKLVIIDYLQLMSSGKRVESRQQEVSEFSRALKLLAKELDVPVIALSQLNRGPEQRTDKKPQVSDLRESGCLTADTTILRADTGAPTTIGALAATGATDIPVWALDESLRYVPRLMTHAFPTGTRPVFRLTTADGRTIRATANHPFLTYDGWRALSDLRRGERLAVPRHVPAPAEEDTSWSDEDVVTAARLSCRMADLRLPSAISSLPKRHIALFLRAVFTEVGGVMLATDHPGGHIFCFADHRDLLDRISPLLWRFGITGHIVHDHTGWMLDIVDLDCQRRFLQEIGIDGESVVDAVRLLGIVRAATAVPTSPVTVGTTWQAIATTLHASPDTGALPDVAATLDHAGMDLTAINDVHWDTITSIDLDGVEQVYDATVLGSHNFVADGIAVHNSIEQDADMVMLLHRESMYEQDSPREGEADIIVAKHRNGPTKTITVAFQGHYSRFTNMATNY